MMRFLIVVLIALLVPLQIRAQLPATQCIASASAAGTSDALTIPSLPCIPTVVMLILKTNLSNATSAPTLQYPGSLPIAIKNANGSVLSPGTFGPNQYSLLTFNGTNWLLLANGGPVPNQPGTIADVRQFGAVCDMAPGLVGDGTIATGSNVLTSANYTFPASKKNEPFVIPGAGGGPFYALSNGNSVAAGGTGYNLLDRVTLTDGTVVIVLTTSSGPPGPVATFGIFTAHADASVPSNPIAQSSTTGSGTGLTVNLTFAGSPLTGTITSVSGQTATLSASAVNGVSGVTWYAGNNDAVALQAAFNAVQAGGSAPGSIYIPAPGCGTNVPLNLPVTGNQSNQGLVEGAVMGQSGLYALASMAEVLHRNTTFGWYGGVKHLLLECGGLCTQAGLYVEGRSTYGLYDDVSVNDAGAANAYIQFGNGTNSVAGYQLRNLTCKSDPNSYSLAQLPSYGLYLNANATDMPVQGFICADMTSVGYYAAGANNHLMGWHVFGSPSPDLTPSHCIQVDAYGNDVVQGHCDGSRNAGTFVNAPQVLVESAMCNNYPGELTVTGCVEVAAGKDYDTVIGTRTNVASLQGNRVVVLDGTPGKHTVIKENPGSTLLLTVAAGTFQIPTCDSTGEGQSWSVSDLTSAAVGVPAVGGGTQHGTVYCDGTGWTTWGN